MKSRKLADKRNQQATELYNNKYHNPTYIAATNGKSNQFANALIDEALAICGSPYYKVSNRNWNEKAIEFLSLFS